MIGQRKKAHLLELEAQAQKKSQGSDSSSNDNPQISDTSASLSNHGTNMARQSASTDSILGTNSGSGTCSFFSWFPPFSLSPSASSAQLSSIFSTSDFSDIALIGTPNSINDNQNHNNNINININTA